MRHPGESGTGGMLRRAITYWSKARGDEVEHTITAGELAQRLDDVLDRVRNQNERFVIELRGEPAATLAPVGPQLGTTLYQALDALGDQDLPGDGFADDLEAAQAAQPPARFPKWPT